MILEFLSLLSLEVWLARVDNELCTVKGPRGTRATGSIVFSLHLGSFGQTLLPLLPSSTIRNRGINDLLREMGVLDGLAWCLGTYWSQ
ncbi:uncharacterized protein EI90DRAFT_3071108 [Cantharellus anzutake]|uniref:uncharacterized protein n=1 Tax=Cantharellus anzutake TaxID=1750568 RepID=UPI0019075F4A|nr:uncharacterized protein EI90DRAFT_3071108 [Cantharellus anzutake]KAF8326005.1 hypothetical protein EI90DRAFT_3071108 [Cantharellus anzutake]